MGNLSRRRMLSLPAALVGGLLLASLLLACGDDGGADQRARSSLPPPPPPTATPEKGSALPLERFHFVTSLTIRAQGAEGQAAPIIVSTEGDFQSPDRHAFTYTISLGGASLSRSLVLIGEEAWLRNGTAQWKEVPRDDPRVAELLKIAFSPARQDFLGGPEYQQVRETVRRLPSKEESVNGVPVNHYRVSAAGREFFETFLAGEQLLQNVQDFAWDVWLAEEGEWPVRLLTSGQVNADHPFLSGLGLLPPTIWELRIDISRPDDPTLSVVAPADGA